MAARRLIFVIYALLPQVAQAGGAEPTFHRDILPILQRRCQSCHRPGEIGPMPLVTFAQTRPWAKAIREAVLQRRMPPWFADRRHGTFANDPSLTAAEIETIDQWAKTGAASGDPAQAPPPLHWDTRWHIPSPDVILRAPQPVTIPARGELDYQYLIFPTPFAIDQWVKAVEIRPSDRSVVHHAVLYIREPGNEWLRTAPKGIWFTLAGLRAASQTTSDILGIYTPGAAPNSWPTGMAKLIPAGSELILQIHYTSKQTPARDQTEVALSFLNNPPQRRVLTLQMGNDRIAIPPGDRDYRISVSGTMPQDALLLSMLPHMHLRGSAFDYQIVGNRGRVETLLRVAPYNFYWQLSYQLATPRLLPKGTRLLLTGYFDNSSNNPRNPDPSVEVTWGEQSRQEMMIGFFDVAVPADVDKQRFFIR
jgi:hypothetical protein